ncbi:MAG: hypothetical protein EXS40_05925 [Opitutaceae bacterium]|nr:hypothetical protein [Opitutaceae bacterium]
MRKSAFRSILAAGALLTFVGSISYWSAMGAHRGWSQNRVPVTQTDEVTGIAFTTYENRFVPGIDILGAGVALAAFFFALSFIFRSPQLLPATP